MSIRVNRKIIGNPHRMTRKSGMMGNKDLFPNLRTTPNPLRSAQRLSGSSRPLAGSPSPRASGRPASPAESSCQGGQRSSRRLWLRQAVTALRASYLPPAPGRPRRAGSSARPPLPARRRHRRGGRRPRRRRGRRRRRLPAGPSGVCTGRVPPPCPAVVPDPAGPRAAFSAMWPLGPLACLAAGLPSHVSQSLCWRHDRQEVSRVRAGERT